MHSVISFRRRINKELSKGLNTKEAMTHITFADDVIITGSLREREREIDEWKEILVKFSEGSGLKISEGKSKLCAKMKFLTLS